MLNCHGAIGFGRSGLRERADGLAPTARTPLGMRSAWPGVSVWTLSPDCLCCTCTSQSCGHERRWQAISPANRPSMSPIVHGRATGGQTRYARTVVRGSSPDSIAVPIDQRIGWKLQREIVLLLAWAPAILLQLAHPLVAQGIADHSTFRTQRGGRAQRLYHTIDAMLQLCFGTEAE